MPMVLPIKEAEGLKKAAVNAGRSFLLWIMDLYADKACICAEAHKYGCGQKEPTKQRKSSCLQRSLFCEYITKAEKRFAAQRAQVSLSSLLFSEIIKYHFQDSISIKA